MIQIKHRRDLSKVPQSNPAFPILDDLCTRLIDNYPGYDPTHDGWLILTESDTLDFSRPLTEIWPDGTAEDSTLLALKHLWESVTLEDDGFYHAIYLANNQFGLYFLIPDCPELPDDVRESLEQSRID